MTQRANILQELNEIGSTLANASPQNVYLAPVGYFDGFADQMLNYVRSIESNDESSSVILNTISKDDLYSIPAGYFDGLEERLMQSVRESADYQTSAEELESISPLLSRLKKENLYNVPQGYFEDFNPKENIGLKTKVVSITHRRWFRYAAAAVLAGAILTTSLLLTNKKSVDPNKNPDEWVAKNIKKVNTDQLDEFMKLAEEDETTKGAVVNKTEKADEIKDLMKDVSDKEIQDFLKETSALGDNGLLN